MEKTAFTGLFVLFVGLRLFGVRDQRQKRVSTLKYNYLWVYKYRNYDMNIMLDNVHCLKYS
jgi:hypothetical protein